MNRYITHTQLKIAHVTQIIRCIGPAWCPQNVNHWTPQAPKIGHTFLWMKFSGLTCAQISVSPCESSLQNSSGHGSSTSSNSIVASDRSLVRFSILSTSQEIFCDGRSREPVRNIVSTHTSARTSEDPNHLLGVMSQHFPIWYWARRNLWQTVFAQGGSRNQPLGFYRATRTHSADYAVARYSSVRPSVTCRYSVNNADHRLS